MTLSNFDWTDKASVRWFILLPSGHEGPYSLEKVAQFKEKKQIADDVKIWAEGLPEALSLSEVLEAKTSHLTDEVGPPPFPEEDIPPIPLQAYIEEIPIPEIPEEEANEKQRNYPIPVWLPVSLGVIGFLFVTCIYISKKQEKFEIPRQAKMTHELHERILKENEFNGWGKKIFFKEYVPYDHSQIWLVTSSYQTCNVEATFTSVKDKLLTMTEDSIVFRSKGHLKDHLVQLANFEFSTGRKLVPGLYEMDVKASNCQWDGVIPQFMNLVSAPEETYQARTKVILFSKGPEEFNKTLESLLKKKWEISEREKNLGQLFWQELQQKFQTLEAISLQIEQHFLDFIEEDTTKFKQNLKLMVAEYTKKFGSFLTSFVIENENDFKSLGPKGISFKRNYELMVRLTSKQIGLESMKYIEELQGLKKAPEAKDLSLLSGRVKKTFSDIKKDINQKLSQVSEDQAK